MYSNKYINNHINKYYQYLGILTIYTSSLIDIKLTQGQSY